MRTLAELSGLAVMSEAGGEILGRIQDVNFASLSGQIDSFLVNPGGIFAGTRVLPHLMVRSLGADALLTEAGDVFAEGKDALAEAEGVTSSHQLHNRPVLNDSGAVLGEVHDVLVDEDRLAVAAYILTSGILDTLLHGHPNLPLAAIKTFGPDGIIVPTTASRG